MIFETSAVTQKAAIQLGASVAIILSNEPP
jgi:hypothetical protein